MQNHANSSKRSYHYFLSILAFLCVMGTYSLASAEEYQNYTQDYHHSIGGGIFFNLDSNDLTPDMGLHVAYAYRLFSRYRMGLEISWGMTPIPLHGALQHDIIRVLFTHEFDLYASRSFVLSLRPDLGYYASRYSPCDSMSCDKADWKDGMDEHFFHSFTASLNMGFGWRVAENWLVKLMLGVGGWIGTTDYHDIYGGNNPVSAVHGMLRLGFEYHL